MRPASPIAGRRLAGWLAALIAIMIFLCVLATAAGLGLVGAAHGLAAGVADRATIQVVEAEPAARERQTRAIVTALRSEASGWEVRIVPDAEVAALIEPWLGALAADVPLPRLIDVASGTGDMQTVVSTVARVAPDARVDSHARWLAPVDRLVSALVALAGGVVLLLVLAMTATVVIAARSALHHDHATVSLLHALGASDGQIAAMFQRRFAIDALAGSLVGLLVAMILLLPLARLVADLGPDLPTVAHAAPVWPWLLLIPVAAVAVALVAARTTVLAALRRRP